MNPLRRLYRAGLFGFQRALGALGLNIAKTSDYYSPLPIRGKLARTRERWDRASELVGVEVDLEGQRTLLRALLERHGAELAELPAYDEIKTMGYGPGFTVHDAQLLYLMLRHHKPARFIEIGSGVSTYYAHLAARRNETEGNPLQIQAIDPWALAPTGQLLGVEILETEVQSTPLEMFQELGEGDVLFIDSTHVVKIDGDVPFLYLEVVPRLAPGVIVHAHDIHFPYNVPHPAQQYVFNAKWPLYWTEAMLLQAFLAFNDRFEIMLSLPQLRYSDEGFLASSIPDYLPLETRNHDTHAGSLWFRHRR